MPVIRLDQLQPFQAINLLTDPGAIAGPRYCPSTADIILKFAMGTGKFANIVLSGRYSGPFAGSVAQANSMMTSLTTGGAWTALAAFLSQTEFLFIAVVIRDIGIVGGGGTLIQSTNSAVPGTSVSGILPAEVAAVVTKRTARSGQQWRGRAYMGGFATNALGTGNIIAAATVTALQNWANTWGSAMVASGYTHVLAQMARAAYTSPTTGRDFPARAAAAIDVTSVTVRDNHWDSQRRRGLR